MCDLNRVKGVGNPVDKLPMLEKSGPPDLRVLIGVYKVTIIINIFYLLSTGVVNNLIPSLI